MPRPSVLNASAVLSGILLLTHSLPLAARQSAGPTRPDAERISPPIITFRITGPKGLLVKEKIDPAYTPQARSAHIQGIVKLDARVEADGAVSYVRILSGHSLLAKPASEALEKWEFFPNPQLPAHVRVSLVFTLNDRDHPRGRQVSGYPVGRGTAEPEAANKTSSTMPPAAGAERMNATAVCSTSQVFILVPQDDLWDDLPAAYQTLAAFVQDRSWLTVIGMGSAVPTELPANGGVLTFHRGGTTGIASYGESARGDSVLTTGEYVFFNLTLQNVQGESLWTGRDANEFEGVRTYSYDTGTGGGDIFSADPIAAFNRLVTKLNKQAHCSRPKSHR